MKLGNMMGLVPLCLIAFAFLGFKQDQIPKNGWPEASRYLQGIPLYEKFEDIAPIFQFDNDTTYILNFWATWCGPCVEELPHFEALREKYADEKVRVILISLDFPRKLESQLLPFLEKQKLASTVLVLLDGKYHEWIDNISPEWSGAIPVSLIYKGDKRSFIPDAVRDLDELENIVKAIKEP